MKKIKVLQLIGSFRCGGAESMVVNLANELREDLFENVLSGREDGPISKGLKKKDALYIIKKDKLIDISHLIKLINFIRAHKVDIIHAHMFGANLYGFLAGKLTGTKIIQTIHGRNCFNSGKRILVSRLMSKFVDKVVTVSDALRVDYLKITNMEEEKICTIHNGVDLDKYIGGNNTRIAKRKELGLSCSSPVIGAVGNIKYVKGYDILIIAALKVLEKHPEAKFVIVGETAEKNKGEKYRLDSLVDELGLRESIYFLGYREDISALLLTFDLYVMTSRSEGLSMALLEAMAAEKPIIATNVGGNSTLVKDKYSGVLIPSEDSVALATQIDVLLNDRDFAARLGANARKYIEKKFSTISMAREYEKLYMEIFDNQ